MRILKVFRRMAPRYPQTVALLWQSLQTRQPDIFDQGFMSHKHNFHMQMKFGPAGQLRWALGNLGWRFMDEHRLRRPCHEQLSLFCADEGYFQHVVREDLRKAVWLDAALRRPEFRGLERGTVDRSGTTALHKKLKGRDKRKLFSNICVFCNLGVPETQAQGSGLPQMGAQTRGGRFRKNQHSRS